MEQVMSAEAAGGIEPARQTPKDIRRALELRLYLSHFLSTWNSRLFEFAAVLFLASIFPDTLLFVSVYALVRSGAAILLSQPIGSWIDKGNRLVVVRASIVGQRLAVAGSCALFLGTGEIEDRNGRPDEVRSLRRNGGPCLCGEVMLDNEPGFC